MFRTIVCLFLLFLPLGLFAEPNRTSEWSRRDAFIEPESLNEKIVFEERGGRWQEKGLQGSYRFVITEFKTGKEKLYLQWVLGDEEIAYSLSVKELNMRPEYSLSMLRCEDDSDCQTIQIYATHYYERNNRLFRIHLQNLGRYMFEM